MRKIIFLFISVIICMAFTSALADNTIAINCKIQDGASHLNSLPISLTIIEEEAFEGTAITSIQLPESITTIEDRAFADNTNLRMIYIPENTTYIGKDVLAGTRIVIVTGFSGSYAGKWAKNNGIPFSPLTVFSSNSVIPHVSGMVSGKTPRRELDTNEKTEEQYDSNPKGRTEGEIKASKLEKCFAFSIQGRSPPMGG